jgi:hypothetical protein
VEAFFQWSLFALVACGFAALAGTGQLDVPTIVFSTTALLARGVMMFRGVRWAIPESYSSYLAVLYALIFAADLFLISRDYVAATVHLVLFATAMKLFSVKRERDYLYLAMLASSRYLLPRCSRLTALFSSRFPHSFSLPSPLFSGWNCAVRSCGLPRRLWSLRFLAFPGTCSLGSPAAW